MKLNCKNLRCSCHANRAYSHCTECMALVMGDHRYCSECHDIVAHREALSKISILQEEFRRVVSERNRLGFQLYETERELAAVKRELEQTIARYATSEEGGAK